MKWPDEAPVVRRVIVPSPAAGFEWSRTADKGGLWLVRGVTFQLVTSAAVATRVVGVQTTEGDDTTMVTSAGTGQVAGLTRRYSGFKGSPQGADSLAAILLAWPPEGFVLPVGCTIGSTTTAIDAGDQYSAIVLDVVEYPATYPEWCVPLTSQYVYNMSNDDNPQGVY